MRCWSLPERRHRKRDLNMPKLNTTITLSETEMAEAITEYLKGKRYEVKGSVSFAVDPGDPSDPRDLGVRVRAQATVEPIPRKKRGDGKEDDAAK